MTTQKNAEQQVDQHAQQMYEAHLALSFLGLDLGLGLPALHPLDMHRSCGKDGGGDAYDDPSR